MTDKELIKQEIEETLNGLFDYIPSASKVLYNDFTKDEAVVLGKYKALEDILKFIDSLPEESTSEDLEEEFYRFIDEEEGIPKMCNTRECIAWGVDIASHFAEWQKQKAMQDFLEKACDWLSKQPMSRPVFWTVEDFKNYMQDE